MRKDKSQLVKTASFKEKEGGRVTIFGGKGLKSIVVIVAPPLTFFDWKSKTAWTNGTFFRIARKVREERLKGQEATYFDCGEVSDNSWECYEISFEKNTKGEVVPRQKAFYTFAINGSNKRVEDTVAERVVRARAVEEVGI